MKRLLLNEVFKMGMLFVGKTGGILVGIYFLPLFNRILGTEQFGLVALILSFQALLLTIDFGMSTLVGRDVALHKSLDYSSKSTWRNSEVVMSSLYFIITLSVIVWWLLQENPMLNLFTICGVVILFWTLTLQNINFSALLGSKSYVVASSLQLTGVLIRAIATVIALKNIEPTIEVFVYTQMVISLAFLLITRTVCNKILSRIDKGTSRYQINISDCIKLLVRGKPLILFSVSGALVMYSDKILISFFMTPNDLVPYYYAFSLCMLPLSILAGPVKQYFQPIIISKLFEKNEYSRLVRVIKLYAVTLTFIVFVPTSLLWLLSESVVNLWLGVNIVNEEVISLTKILLPGFAFGSLGYIPYVLLVTLEDFKFQATYSVILTSTMLVAISLVAYNHSLEGICWLYFIYHTFSTIGWWVRVCFLKEIRFISFVSIRYSLGCGLLIFVLAYMVNVSLPVV